MFQTNFGEKMKRRILCSVSFYPQKSYRLRDNVEKHGIAEQATEDITALALFMLDN